MDIVQALAWIVEGGGAGILAYMAMERIRPLREIGASWKREVSVALASLLGIVAWGGLLWWGAEPTPITPQEWVGAMFRVAFLAVATSQGIHGFKKLPK